MKKIFTLFLLSILTIQTWAFEQNKYYTINRNGESASYIYASNTQMNTGALNANDGMYVWQFIPTGKENCYYIKNVATDTYIQTTKVNLNDLVQLGTAPVEYMVSTGAGTTGNGTTYFIASTDQGSINYAEDATLGLNKGATGIVAYYIKTGRGNSYWEIKETNYTTTGPTPPATEEDDVCPALSVYRMPCGTYSAKTRLTQISITGDGALGELNCKPATTGRYTLYTHDRATLMPSGKVKLTATLVGAEEAGLVVTVWADFDGDGHFDTAVKPTLGEQIEAEFVVPETLKSGQGRFRIRVDQSGGETANADFYGTMYDLPFYVGSMQTQRTLKVSTNNAERGTVAIEGHNGTSVDLDLGTEVTIVATVKEGFYFHGWRKGRTIVSQKTTYTTRMTENKDLVALFATYEGEVIDEEDDGSYPVNFPKSTTATRTDRKLNGVSLTPAGGTKQSISLSGNKVYNNLSAKETNFFTCDPKAQLTAEFNYTGVWMHGYVYVDEDNDKQFSYKEGEIDQSGTELKSFSFYSGSFTDDSKGYNSAGTSITGSNRNTLFCPTFTAPAEPGLYRIRFKVDWNSVDPGGQLAADGTPTGANGIIANGGFIVDATLSVVSPVGIDEVTTNNTKMIYTIDGRMVQNQDLNRMPKGVYIVGNKKVLVK